MAGCVRLSHGTASAQTSFAINCYGSLRSCDSSIKGSGRGCKYPTRMCGPTTTNTWVSSSATTRGTAALKRFRRGYAIRSKANGRMRLLPRGSTMHGSRLASHIGRASPHEHTRETHSLYCHRVRCIRRCAVPGDYCDSANQLLRGVCEAEDRDRGGRGHGRQGRDRVDRKSTRLNSSHLVISYA